MLTYLHIKNIALVDEIEMEFDRGLTVVTGETGAGKSVIAGSLNFILGERSDAGQIRSGENKALIEAGFDISADKALVAFLQEEGIECDPREFFVKRELSRDGKGRCFVCGSLVTLATLGAIGDYLVDMHGQHDHQALLHSAKHTGIVDRYGSLEGFCDEVKKSFAAYAALKAQRDDIVANRDARQRELDFLKFQLDELTKADLQENEDEELNREFEILRNAAHLKEVTSGLYGALYEADESLIGGLGRIEQGLSELTRFDPGFGAYMTDFKGAAGCLREIAEAVRAFRDRVEINEGRLREVEDRIVLLERIKKKYGGTLAQAMALRDELRKKVGNIENADEELSGIERRLEDHAGVLAKATERLSKRRGEAAKKLAAAVRKELEELGMPGTAFDAQRVPCEAGPNGGERIEFLISPNKGEALKPLSSIASGGEISRVMLAVKKVIADTDRVPTLVFDEIDANIGGRVAGTVGERLKEVSRDKQVVCITHLPQIAAQGDHHYSVEKKEALNRTVTAMRKLTAEERRLEITRMLGASGDTASAARYADELLKASRSKKQAADSGK